MGAETGASYYSSNGRRRWRRDGGRKATIDSKTKVYLSPWGLLFLFPICLAFVICGVLIVLQDGQELASYLLGWFILALAAPVSVFVVISRMVLMTDHGFKVPPRRWISWDSAQWSEVTEVASFFLPTFAAAVVMKEKDLDGRSHQHLLLGTASFADRGRLTRLVDEMNDKIAAANPGDTIDPWLRRTDRPDNR